MLTCKDFLKELSEYLDQSVDPETRQHLDEHLNACPNCWVVLDTTKKTVQIYKGEEPKAIPSSVHDRLMAAVQKKMAERKESCH
ncbi:MAG: zf-HC2 domain-containing protein [Bryobacter sp.]|nr:zf-HC2 domain-containing protein [Bryobacter sp.]